MRQTFFNTLNAPAILVSSPHFLTARRLLLAILMLAEACSLGFGQGSFTISGINYPAANNTFDYTEDLNNMPVYWNTLDYTNKVYWSNDNSRWELWNMDEGVIFYSPVQSLYPPCSGWVLYDNDASGLPTLTGGCAAGPYTPGANEPPNYSFSAFSRTYAELSNAATTLSEVMDDDAMSGPIALPFNFQFAGEAKNTIYVTSNGWMCFDAPVAVPTDNTADNLNATPGGAVFPLADDLAGDGMSFAGYEVTGTTPNRIFKIEWRNYRWRYDAQDYGISFQVWLYETSNIIDFVYRQESGDVSPDGAVIGIGKNIFSYLVLADASSNPGTSNSVFYNTIAQRPATDQVYQFSPPPSCATPTAYNLTGGGTYCSGSPVAIGLAGSESGVTYQLVRDGSTDVGSPVSGTDEAISFTAQSTAGAYTVVATRTTGGCTAAMTGSATVVPDATAPSVTCPSNVAANTSAGGTGDCYGTASWSAPSPTDNCSASIQSVSHASGSAFATGSTTVTYTVADAAGNTATCSFTVTVSDNEAPSITCASNVTVNNTANLCTGTATLIEPTVADNCTLTSVGSALHFDGTNDWVQINSDIEGGSLFSFSTWFYATNGSNGKIISSSTFEICVCGDGGVEVWTSCGAQSAPSGLSLNDWHNLIVVCNSSTLSVYLDGSFWFSFGCDALATISSPKLGSHYEADCCRFSGKLDEMSFWNIALNASQRANLQSNTLIGDESGLTAYYNFDEGTGSTLIDHSSGGHNGTLTNFALTGSTSNWVTGHSASSPLSNNAPATYPQGTTTVTWTATDESGNTNTCAQTVTVSDAQAPTISNCPTNPTANTSGNGMGDCSTTVSWTAPTASDNCDGPLTPTGSHTPGSVFAKGSTTVTYNVSDAAGNAAVCSFTVTVSDNEAPTISNCPTNQTANTSSNGTGDCSATVTWTAPTANDNCDGSLTPTASHASGSAFATGSTAVTYTATDAAGNTRTCSFTVTISDNESPSVTCPFNVAVNTSAGGTGDCNGVASWTTPTPTDNCSASIQSVSHASGSSFDIGETTVTYTATDAAGNTATCEFMVTILDNEAPSIVCPSNMTINTSAGGTGDCYGTTSWTEPSPDDNCSAGIINVTHTSGSSFDLGATTVIYTAEDGGYNPATCSFTVTVVDNEVPSLTCPSNVSSTTSAGGTGDCNGTASWTTPTPTDNCSASISSVSHASGSTFAIGSTTVTYTAADPAGNTATCAFTVSISDNETPTAICQNLTVALNSMGAASASASQINNGSTDNCTSAGSLSLSLSQTAFDCEAAGAQSVSLTVTDAAGNSSQCTATINVLDVLNFEESNRRTPSNGLAGDRFGWSTALDGNWGGAGAPEKKVGTQNKQGAVGILSGASSWSIFKQVSASDGAAIDYFGNAVSLDGSLLLVGAYGDNVGTSPIKSDQGSAVFFSQNSGGADNWGQIKQVFAPDGAAYDYFGQAVSLKNGVAIVGANKAKIGAAAAQGGAYVFSQNLGGANNWGYLKKLTANDAAVGDWFGASTSVSSDYALIGAPNKGGYMGAAYIFGKDTGGSDNWGQAKKLAPADCATNDRFGTAVALNGDYAFVSAQRHGGKGAVYVFQKDMGGADNWGQIAKYMAADGANNDQFGFSLAAQGASFIAGANLDDVSGKADIGSVYFFTGETCPEPRPAFGHVPGKAIEKIEQRGGSKLSLTASPNPFRDEIWLDISSENGARLTLSDAAGRTLRQVDLSAGMLRFSLIVNDLQPGLYFLKTADEQGARTIPVVKVE